MEGLRGRHDANYHCVAVLLHLRHDSVVEVCPQKTLFEVTRGEGGLVDAEGLRVRGRTLKSL